MSIIIRKGRLLDPASGRDEVVDIQVQGERVQKIAAPGSLSENGATVVEADGAWILPGLVDIHVHLRDPGLEYKEDIASGCAAAACGGFTTVVAMPNTKPAIDKADLVQYVRQRGREVGLCRVLPSGAITVGQKGAKLAPFAEMKEAGAVAFTDDGRPVENSALMASALEYARSFDMPVLTHAEDLCLSHGGHMHEGAVSTRLGIAAVSRVAEDAVVARDIMLAEYAGAHLHVCHVSTAAAVELVRRAKERGAHITAEATPHHFSLTDEAVEGFCTSAKMNPPLREEADRLAVVAGLKDGTLDAVATDHAPHSAIEKDVAFADAAHGVIGLQTALPLALALWRTGEVPLMTVVERLTLGPCRALKLPHGRVAVGELADLVVVDPEAKWRFTEEENLSKSSNSPFFGRELQGRVMATVLEGRVVHRHGAADAQ